MNSENLYTKTSARSSVTHEEIAHRARELWNQYGQPTDRDEEIWLEAEKQLTQQPPPSRETEIGSGSGSNGPSGSSSTSAGSVETVRNKGSGSSGRSRGSDSIASEDVPGSGQSGLSNPGSRSSRGR